jgi:hypothetical protein
MRRYRNLLPLLVHTEDGSYAQGEEFEKEFSPDDERANVESGLLAIVPQRYKVVGTSIVHDTEPDGEFEAGLLIEHEGTLIAGGHIALVEKPKPVKESRKKEAKT